jgi:hypothetical protein
MRGRAGDWDRIVRRVRLGQAWLRVTHYPNEDDHDASNRDAVGPISHLAVFHAAYYPCRTLDESGPRAVLVVTQKNLNVEHDSVEFP